MSEVRLYLLGPPRLEQNNEVQTVDTRKAIALLAYVAITGSNHTRETLAALLWPEYEPANARAALRRTLSALRRADAESVLEISRELVGPLPGSPLWVDVEAFGQLLDNCEQHGHAPSQVCDLCQAPLQGAIDLYQDEFMAGFTLRDSPAFDEWQYFQRESLRARLAGALERLAQLYGRRGEYETAVPLIRHWLALDTLREEAHRALMELYARSGQREAALRQYRECVHILDEELGVTPLPETTVLYEAIRENRLVDSEQLTVDNHQLPTVNYQLSTPKVPFVGRRDELARLRQIYEQVGPDGRFLVIEGEAGVGKTRLAAEFLATLPAATVISARCYEGETDLAYAPFIAALRTAVSQPHCNDRIRQLPDHWLAEAARLLPELAPGTQPPATSSDPGAQTRLFEATAQLLLAATGTQPSGILVLDDAHWADADSLALLTYLARRLAGRPLFILITWRSESVPSHHRLRTLLAESQRADWGTALPLSRLGSEEVAALVRAVHTTAPAQLEERLYRETEGLPFFVVAYLAAIAEAATLSEAETAVWEMPSGVQELLYARLTAVSETARQLLQTAAVIGRSFTFDSVQAASGRSEEETVTALEQLMDQGVLMESVTGGTLAYDFHHEKMRTLVYQETSLARQRLLHRRVADGLAQHQKGSAGQIAHHYQLAGQAGKAANYYKLAGEEARRVYANAAALRHFQAALALGYPETAVLHEAIGDLQTLQGEYEAALASYETAVAQTGAEDAARLEQKLGHVHQRRGEWELATSHLEAALVTTQLPGERAYLLADSSFTAYQRGDRDRALALAQEALTLAETADDATALMQALNVLGMLARAETDLVGARQHLQRSLALAESVGDVARQTAVLNNLALVETAAGHTDDAHAYLRQALVLCQTFGDRHREAALHNNLADLYRQTGQRDEAMASLKTAVAIYADIGDQQSHWQPEIWKLTEW
jgi:DNA-binding SARP family transcriptional activator/predicted negative regulator of RcsB-dependent stress response